MGMSGGLDQQQSASGTPVNGKNCCLARRHGNPRYVNPATDQHSNILQRATSLVFVWPDEHGAPIIFDLWSEFQQEYTT